MSIDYKEPFLSKAIFNIRYFYFKALKVCKKLKKVIKNRKDYFSLSHIKEKIRPDITAHKEVPVVTPVSAVLQNNSSDDDGALSDRLAVYTCIFGGYDMICEPLYKSKMCDYYIITDGDVSEKSVWKKIDYPKPEGFEGWDPSIKNRYFKMHPELVFPDYKYSLYVDGNVKLLTDMYPYVKLMKNKVIGIHDHPVFDCFYASAEHLKKLKLVDGEVCDRQTDAYRNEGFPENFGYFECSIIIRKHNSEKCKKLMNTWWEQYNAWVKRDQQAFVYSLWKNSMNRHDVFCLGENLRKSPRFIIRDHNRSHYLVR